MDDMVEKVARAICASIDGQDPDAMVQTIPDDPEQMPLWREYSHEARAAIAAMRGPTPQMVAATLPMPGRQNDPQTVKIAEQALFFLEGIDFPFEAHRKGMDAAQDLISDWYSMIDAALGPKGE